MAYTKQGPFADRALPALTGARATAMDQGIADAHDYGVPVIKSLSGGLPVDFTGLADDTLYELSVRGVLDAPNRANQPGLYALVNGASIAGVVNALKRTWNDAANTLHEDLQNYGTGIGPLVGTMDFNAQGLLVSRALFWRSSSVGSGSSFVMTSEWTFSPLGSAAVITYRGGCYMDVAATMASIRLAWGPSPGTLNGSAMLKKVG